MLSVDAGKATTDYSIDREALLWLMYFLSARYIDYYLHVHIQRPGIVALTAS